MSNSVHSSQGRLSGDCVSVSLPRHQDPIVAIATAPGRGAVGIVRVSGKNIGPLIQALFGRQLRAREATYLPFLDRSQLAIDQGIALYFPAPHSFTGEDVLELQAHGGPVVLQLLLARCIEAAAELDSTMKTPRLKGLRVALPGAFSKEIHTLRDALIHLRMLVEATLDFPEEEIDFLRKADAHGQLSKLQEALKAVLQRAHQGALLREGIKVVIAGQPNAGKSSLLNALAGAELAIVTPIAGTTRDKVQQTIQIEGVPVHVIDTAGLRDSTDEIEKIGIARAWDVIEAADAVVFLHDLTRKDAIDYIAADAVIARSIAEMISASVPVIEIWNKADVIDRPCRDAGLLLSAKTGAGLDTLRRRLLEVAGWQSKPEGVYMARERHVQALNRTAAHLMSASFHLESKAQALDLLAEELRLAQNALGEITGDFSSDDLLGVIFSRFCIGK